jgi:hypothetical protein
VTLGRQPQKKLFNRGIRYLIADISEPVRIVFIGSIRTNASHGADFNDRAHSA